MLLIGASLIGIATALLMLSHSWKILLATVVLLIIGVLIFATTRHAQLLKRREATKWPQRPFHKFSSTPKRSEYYVAVLGSGGHTKEMLMMMDDGTCEFEGTHRRYLISSGDQMSENHLKDYEEELQHLCEDKGTSAGTHDTFVVTRARRVHQPLWSTPFSALLSILDIFPVLLSPPIGDAPMYPTMILSNGPATGFFVALAVHWMKMMYLVPEGCMKFVYVESWARISTLSLTGKLLYYTGIADAFYVQHEEVASKYGLQNAGEMVFNARRPEA